MTRPSARTFRTMQTIVDVCCNCWFASPLLAVFFVAAIHAVLARQFPFLLQLPVTSSDGHLSLSVWHFCSTAAIGLGIALGTCTRTEMMSLRGWMIPQLRHEIVLAYGGYAVVLCAVLLSLFPFLPPSPPKLVLLSLAFSLFCAGASAGASAKRKRTPRLLLVVFAIVAFWPALFATAAIEAPIPIALVAVAVGPWLLSFDLNRDRWRAGVELKVLPNPRIIGGAADSTQRSALGRVLRHLAGLREGGEVSVWTHGAASPTTSRYLNAIQFEGNMRSRVNIQGLGAVILVLTAVSLANMYLIGSSTVVPLFVISFALASRSGEPRFLQLISRESRTKVRFWHTVRQSIRVMVLVLPTIALANLLGRILGIPRRDAGGDGTDLVMGLALVAMLPIWDFGRQSFVRRRMEFQPRTLSYIGAMLLAPIALAVVAVAGLVTGLFDDVVVLLPYASVLLMGLVIHAVHRAALVNRFRHNDLLVE